MQKTVLRAVIRSILAGVIVFPVFSQAAVSLDRTRVIFDGGQKSMTLNISNENRQLPYLAQAWLEDAEGKKLTAGPLVVTPPLQRLEPGKKSLVRIQAAAGAELLARDRESLFYFSLREIPPKSEKPNVLQIALQTQVKLFYRPAEIKAEPGEVWQEKLVLHKVAGGYRIENPTPYYITVIGMGNTKKAAETAPFEAVMVAPKSSEVVRTAQGDTPYLTYINDYGGRPVLPFACEGNVCTAVPGK